MLSGLSDVALFASRKFSTDHQLDRSQAVFPARYVSAIGSRLGMVSKGEGALERVEMGKINGAKGVFQSVCRPKTLNLRYVMRLNYIPIVCRCHISSPCAMVGRTKGPYRLSYKTCVTCMLCYKPLVQSILLPFVRLRRDLHLALQASL